MKTANLNIKIRYLKVGKIKFANNLAEISWDYAFSNNKLVNNKKALFYIGVLVTMFSLGFQEFGKETVTISSIRKLFKLENLLNKNSKNKNFNKKIIELLSKNLKNEGDDNNDIDNKILKKSNIKNKKQFLNNWLVLNQLVNGSLDLYLEQPHIKNVLISIKDQKSIENNLKLSENKAKIKI